MPARRAARTFSLIPLTGRTFPRSVISPVIAMLWATVRPVSSEIREVWEVSRRGRSECHATGCVRRTSAAEHATQHASQQPFAGSACTVLWRVRPWDCGSGHKPSAQVTGCRVTPC